MACPVASAALADREHREPAPGVNPPSPRRPAHWLAILRFVVGAWFAKSVLTKLTVEVVAGVVPVPAATERWVRFMPTRVSEFAAGNPLEPYRRFLTEVVLAHGELFAHLTAVGESAVGLLLVAGLVTRYAAVGGLFLAVNYLLATFWLTPTQLGFHLLLAVCLIAFAASGAGRVWGLDALLMRRSRRYASLVERLRAA